MRFLTFILILTACAAQKPKPQLASIRFLEIQRADDPALEDCVKRCDPDDAAMASALQESIRVQEDYIRHRPVSQTELEHKTRKMAGAALTWYQKKKDSQNPTEALRAYQVALIVEKMGFAGITPPNFHTEIESEIAKLPSRFPKEALSYLLQGELLSNQTAPLEDIIRAFRQCLELDPTQKECKKRYGDAVSDYQSPYCAGEGLDPSLGFYLSSKERNSRFPKALHSSEGKIFVEKAPQLSRMDIARLMVVPASLGQSSFDELRMEMTPEGARKLSELTAQHVHGYLAVALKDKAILNAVIESPISEGKVSVALGDSEEEAHKGDSLFETACKKPISRKLPEELQTKAKPM